MSDNATEQIGAYGAAGRAVFEIKVVRRSLVTSSVIWLKPSPPGATASSSSSVKRGPGIHC